MAKQADRLSREHRADGGLAGRQGYQNAGAVRPSFANRDFLEKADRELDPNYTPTTDDLASVDASAEGADSWRRITPEDGAKLLASEGVAPSSAEAAPAPAVEQVQPFKRPEVTIPTGVAGDIAAQANKPMPAAAPAAGEDNNFFRGIAKGKATSIIPLLSGIAAMGTAPTRSLGVALATGLGAGAQAAQGQRAFGLKQGELKVAQQLADAKTMEITKGILEGRYQFLEDGQVWDKYSDTFLPADQATIAKAKAFAKGPQEALAATSPAGVSRAEYLKTHPTAGSVVPNLPASHSYNSNPSNARETILAAGELNPGVMEARADRDKSEYKMKEIYAKLSAPGVGTERYNQLSNLYDRAKGDYDRADA
jgi:hypothetical protein